jgi:hypothetical protein
MGFVRKGDRRTIVRHRQTNFGGVVARCCVSRSIAVFCKSGFSVSPIEALTFESNNQLRRIEKQCFELTNLKSLAIPSLVNSIDESAFTKCKIASLFVEPENV